MGSIQCGVFPQSIQWSDLSNRMYVGCATGSVKIFDVLERKQTGVLRKHRYASRRRAFVANGHPGMWSWRWWLFLSTKYWLQQASIEKSVCGT